MPRTPKPPGITTASTPAKAASAPAGVAQSSDVTHRMVTPASFAKPPARIASVTER